MRRSKAAEHEAVGPPWIFTSSGGFSSGMNLCTRCIRHRSTMLILTVPVALSQSSSSTETRRDPCPESDTWRGMLCN